MSQINLRDAFLAAVHKFAPEFGIDLAEDRVNVLADYFELVLGHNPLLHLVAPCTPEEFAVRHVLESLVLLEFLPPDARFVDVGTGAGLPSIPCLIASPHLNAILVESKEKKAVFLSAAIGRLGLSERARVENRQFEEVPNQRDFQFVTCRALDKFVEKLPRLVKWSKDREMLLFGGPSLRDAIGGQNLKFTEKLLPLSEQRFLFRVPPRAAI